MLTACFLCPSRIEKEKYPSLVILLFRMVLDTTDHHMRESATQALRIMMNRTQDQATLSAIAASLHELMSTLSFRDRYVAISFLPLDFARGRALMRGLVYRLLFPLEQVGAYPLGLPVMPS